MIPNFSELIQRNVIFATTLGLYLQLAKANSSAFMEHEVSPANLGIFFVCAGEKLLVCFGGRGEGNHVTPGAL